MKSIQTLSNRLYRPLDCAPKPNGILCLTIDIVGVIIAESKNRPVLPQYLRGFLENFSGLFGAPARPRIGGAA